MKRIFFLAATLVLCIWFIGCERNGQDLGQNAEPVSPTNKESPKDDTSETGSATNTPVAKTDESPELGTQTTESPDKKSSTAPRFEDYPAKEKHEGKTAPLKFDPETSMFKTRFRTAAKGAPNFGGRYIVATWGCGTDCVTGGVIDAKTGNTYMIPFSVCCIFEKDPAANKIEIRLNSRLIKFNGLLNEKEDDVFRHYFLFENDRFERVSEDK